LTTATELSLFLDGTRAKQSQKSDSFGFRKCSVAGLVGPQNLNTLPGLDDRPTRLDEFTAHCIEKGLEKFETKKAENQVADQLRGLGYIE
jgi:hypothetical protein